MTRRNQFFSSVQVDEISAWDQKVGSGRPYKSVYHELSRRRSMSQTFRGEAKSSSMQNVYLWLGWEARSFQSEGHFAWEPREPSSAPMGAEAEIRAAKKIVELEPPTFFSSALYDYTTDLQTKISSSAPFALSIVRRA